jgi:hypothetical protein
MLLLSRSNNSANRSPYRHFDNEYNISAAVSTLFQKHVEESYGRVPPIYYIQDGRYDR